MYSRTSVVALLVAGTFASCAHAQQADAPADARELEKIIVTGEKVERPLEDTAPSVHVLDQRALIENPSLSTTNTVLEGIPNLTSTGTGNLAPAVRGVDGTGPTEGIGAFIAGTRPRLGLQIDGRSAHYNEVVFGDFSTWDVKQIEVFRGAQSLLQGRNTIAGTVVLKSNDPVFEREIGGRVMAGSHGQRQYAAVLNAPLADNEAAFRLAVDRQRYDSFVHGMQAYAGVGDPGEYESTTLRGKLLLKPSALPDFTTLFTFAHTDHLGPQSEHVVRPFRKKNAAYPEMNTFRTRTNSGVLDSTWRLSDLLSFENRISLSDFAVMRTAPPEGGNLRIDGKDFAIEPRLVFDGRTTSGFVGAYYFHAKQDEFIDIGNSIFDDKTSTVAVYGEMTRALNRDLKLTLGARYEEERRRREGALMVWAVDLNETYRAFLPKAVLSWQAAEGLTLGAGVSRGFNAGGAGITLFAPFTAFEFDPEYVWTYEGFARAAFLGGKLQLTGNVFYSDYKNMQLPFDLNPHPAAWATVIRNADRAETYGAEIGLTWQPTRALRLNAEIGLLRTRIREFDNNAEMEGNELARSPALTAAFGVQYRHTSGVEVGVNARYSQSYYSEVMNFSRGKVDPYWIVNARLGYNLREYRLFAFVNNLFDEDSPVLIEADPANPAAADTALLPRPRMVGVGLEAWF